MTLASLFAKRLAHLLVEVVRDPENIDAHRVTVRELVALNEQPVTLEWDNWQLRADEDVLPPSSPELLMLLSRMAAHGVRRLSFAARTDRDQLLAAVWEFAQDPALGDGGVGLRARLALLGRSVTVS